MIGFYAGDALAMPVHWYYDLNILHDHWGDAGITKYEKPKTYLPGSIMNLSNTGGAGRGSDKGSIIGDVINHGKKQYWIRGGDYNYHHTLNAGTVLIALLTYLFTHLYIYLLRREYSRCSSYKSINKKSDQNKWSLGCE